MPPLHKWQAGLLLESVAIEHGVLTMGLLKRDDDPNDVGCHGWGCYTGAEKSGIIFMSIIVPMVLFFIFWFLITRPMDDLSIDSDLSETEQRQTHPPLETAQPAQPQVQQLPQESQPAAQPAAQPVAQAKNTQPVGTPAPVCPVQPAEAPPPPPGPQAASPQQSQQTPVQSLLKLPAIAISSNASPAAMHQSPTVVLNFNTPQMSNAFVSPPRDSAVGSPAGGTPVQEPSHKQVQPPPGQQQADQPHGPSSETHLEQQPEPGSAFTVPQPPIPQGVPETSQLPFPPFPPFPPGMPGQAPGHPIYVAAPQFMTVIPPPPPPLAGQPGQPFPASSGPIFTSQIPQITSHGTPVAPPGFHVRLPHIVSPQSQSQPSSPTTMSSTAQQSMMSWSHRHPPLGRARTISDARSDHGSSGHSRKTAMSGMSLPSETSTGNNSASRGRKEAKRAGRKHAHDRRDDRRRSRHSYRRHSDDRHKQIDKHRLARRPRPARRESSRSPSPRIRRFLRERPTKDKKASRLSFLAPLIPIALGALGVVAEAEAEKRRRHSQDEDRRPQRRHSPSGRYNTDMHGQGWRARRSHEAGGGHQTQRRNRSTHDQKGKKRALLEHLRGGHISSGGGDDGSSGSTSFWRFRDSGSLQREELAA